MELTGKLRGLGRLARFHWLLSVHRARDPHKSGLSFGIGVFLGFLPLGALATILAFFMTRRAGLPTPPAVAGTFAGNWITTPFIYAASFWTGRLLTTGKLADFTATEPSRHGGWVDGLLSILAQGPSFFLGIVVVSLLGACIGYVVIRNAVVQVRKLRHHRYARHIEKMGGGV